MLDFILLGVAWQFLCKLKSENEVRFMNKLQNGLPAQGQEMMVDDD
jgi:hypothetical protein